MPTSRLLVIMHVGSVLVRVSSRSRFSDYYVDTEQMSLAKAVTALIKRLQCSSTRESDAFLIRLNCGTIYQNQVGTNTIITEYVFTRSFVEYDALVVIGNTCGEVFNLTFHAISVTIRCHKIVFLIRFGHRTRSVSHES